MRACVYMRVRACEPGWVQRGRARVSSGQGLLRRADAGTLGAGLAAPVPHQALARTRVCTCMHTHIHACAHLCAQAGGSCPPVGDLASTRGGGGRHCLQRGDPAPHHTGTVARGGWLLPLQFAASVSPSSSLSPCPQIQAPTWGRGVVCGRTQESGHPSLGGGVGPLRAQVPTVCGVGGQVWGGFISAGGVTGIPPGLQEEEASQSSPPGPWVSAAPSTVSPSSQGGLGAVPVPTAGGGLEGAAVWQGVGPKTPGQPPGCASVSLGHQGHAWGPHRG